MWPLHVWLVIGIPVALLIWSVASAFIVAALTVVAVQLGVVIAMVGYVIGVPWSLWFRATKGRCPSNRPRFPSPPTTHGERQ